MAIPSDLVRLSSTLPYMSSSVPWWAFSSSEPQLAERVKDLFEQSGRAFGYLATIRADGGPRVHPVSPVLAGGRLLCFVLPPPPGLPRQAAQAVAGAGRDLERDSRYALHAQSLLPSVRTSPPGARRDAAGIADPGERPDDEAYLAGRAFPVADDTDRARVALAQRADADAGWQLFELTIAVAVLTHRPRTAAATDHAIWHAP